MESPLTVEVRRDVAHVLRSLGVEDPGSLNWMTGYLEVLPTDTLAEVDEESAEADQLYDLRKGPGRLGEAVWTSRKVSNVRWHLKDAVLHGAGPLTETARAVLNADPLFVVLSCLALARVVRDNSTVELTRSMGVTLERLFLIAREERTVSFDAFMADMASRLPETDVIDSLQRLADLQCIRWENDELAILEDVRLEAPRA